MTKLVFIGAAIASVAMASIAEANDTTAEDLVNHKTVSASADTTKLKTKDGNASEIHDVLETRLTAGAYDNQFSKDFPVGTKSVMRMTYANYDFQPVWTSASVDSLMELCSSDESLQNSCARVSDVAATRFATGDNAERADADVALTRIYLNYAATNHYDIYTGGQWVERETGGSEPILVASLRAAGAGGIDSGVDILDPEASEDFKYGLVSSPNAAGSLP